MGDLIDRFPKGSKKMKPEGIFIQKRSKSIRKILESEHYEIDKISYEILAGRIEQKEKKKSSKNKYLTQSRLWMLNQRQGDEIENIRERRTSDMLFSSDDYEGDLDYEPENKIEKTVQMPDASGITLSLNKMGVRKNNYQGIPGPLTDIVPEKEDLMSTMSQVGMPESLLQMNIPFALQNHTGFNASWI